MAASFIHSFKSDFLYSSGFFMGHDLLPDRWRVSFSQIFSFYGTGKFCASFLTFISIGWTTPWWLRRNNIWLVRKIVRLTVTSMFVWTQLEAISTRATIGAVCVNTLVCTTTIAQLTLVDIWKGKIRQYKINLIINQTLTRSIILQ